MMATRKCGMVSLTTLALTLALATVALTALALTTLALTLLSTLPVDDVAVARFLPLLVMTCFTAHTCAHTHLAPCPPRRYFSIPDSTNDYMYYFQMVRGGLPSSDGAMPYCECRYAFTLQ